MKYKVLDQEAQSISDVSVVIPNDGSQLANQKILWETPIVDGDGNIAYDTDAISVDVYSVEIPEDGMLDETTPITFVSNEIYNVIVGDDTSIDLENMDTTKDGIYDCRRLFYSDIIFATIGDTIFKLVVKTVYSTYPTQSLEEMKIDKLKDYNTKVDAINSKENCKYSETEQKTFATKYEEAKAYNIDNTASTPFLLELATSLSTTVEIVALSIINKVKSLAQEDAMMKSIRSRISNADTIDELLAIEV